MINFQKVLFSLSLTVFALASTASLAQDAKTEPGSQESTEAVSPFGDKPQVILFKIHDIKPVVNAEGATTACEYTATFFNRTPLSLRQAKINFGWNDDISEKFFAEEEENNEEENAEGEKQEKAPKPAPKANEKEPLGSILSSVDLPALGSLRQISVQGRAETDKCFALFDNLKFEVSVCNILGQDGSRQGRDNVRGNVNCAGLFAFVNSKHPEYYGEFKEISYEEQVAMEKTAEEKETEAIANVNKKIVSNLEQITTTLSEIK